MINITIIIIIFSIFLTILLLIRGISIFDKLLALNLINSLTVTFITLYAVKQGDYFLLDLSIAYGIIGYLGITLLSLFILKGGREK